MKTPSSLNRETLQQLLANAFAVQQSQINTRTLSDIMDVQRSVARGKLDLDGAMRHIVESARSVANATGVAIALLKRDRLTYRAGSGTSASDVGQQVTASLTVSADNWINREILRVENAQTDTRIEADICRQFGANALLILSIYQDRAIAGVLDIRFSEAHTFQDHEIRTYRLMAEQIEAALSYAAKLDQTAEFNRKQLDEEKNVAPELPPIPDAFEPIEPPSEDLVPLPEFTMLPENEHSLFARCGAVLAAIPELPLFQQSAQLATKLTQLAKIIPWSEHWRSSNQAVARELSSVFKPAAVLASTLAQRVKNLTWPRHWRTSAQPTSPDLSTVFKRAIFFATQRAKNVTWPSQWRTLTVAAVAVVLAFTGLIAYWGRGSARSLESSTLSNSSAVDQQADLPKPLPGRGASPVPVSAPSKEATPVNTALKRVRVSAYEVDYVGEDVTVRIFTDKRTIKRSRVQAGRVSHFGDDVTVRYFSPIPAATRTASR